MNPAEIVIALRADGFVLTAEGDRIRIEPGDRLTKEAFALIRANQPALLELLQAANEQTGAARIANIGHGGDRVSEQAADLPVVSQSQAAEVDAFVDIDREAFEERAAIIEYDGGYSRPEAELLAAWEATQALFARLTAREWLARYAPERLPEGDRPENYPKAQIRPGNDFFLERERRGGSQPALTVQDANVGRD